MPVKYFEDLEVWKEARHLPREVYRLTSDSKFLKDFGLSNQIQRARFQSCPISPRVSSEAGIQNSSSFFTLQRVPVLRRVLSSTWHSIRDTSGQKNARKWSNLLSAYR